MENVVLPFKMADKTKGGLYLGQETLERQQVGSTCGLVLAWVHTVMTKKNFLKDLGVKKVIGYFLQNTLDPESRSMAGKLDC